MFVTSSVCGQWGWCVTRSPAAQRGWQWDPSCCGWGSTPQHLVRDAGAAGMTMKSQLLSCVREDISTPDQVAHRACTISVTAGLKQQLG